MTGNSRAGTRGKWRPRLGAVILVILLTALALPLTGLFFFRVYENQLIRQTEGELIGQAAVLAATYKAFLAAEGAISGEPPVAPPVVASDRNAVTERLGSTLTPETGPYDPVLPRLDLAVDPILGRRPDARAAASPPEPAALTAGQRIEAILTETQRATLAGFRVLDGSGTVVAGRGETGQSLAHVPEVAAALGGKVSPVLRIRVSDQPAPPVYSISRGTKVRVFLAWPVMDGARVAGVIYVSRTPSNIIKHLHEERGKLILAGLVTLAATLLIGFVATRTISGPIKELTARTRRIEAGDPAAMMPLRHNGTREVAELSASFLSMAGRLKERSDHVETFASHVSHELKSPLTSIQGAAELMRDAGDTMEPAQRERFLSNIIGDTERLTALVRRLFELARAEAAPESRGTSTLDEILAAAGSSFPLHVRCEGGGTLPLAIGTDPLSAVLSNLALNASQHGATEMLVNAALTGGQVQLRVSDNGTGISPKNRERIFEPFFTTRRAEGGTGMGLQIVRAMLRAHGGDIVLATPSQGTEFVITLPAVES
jgi:signal transduction histidine kinase